MYFKLIADVKSKLNYTLDICKNCVFVLPIGVFKLYNQILMKINLHYEIENSDYPKLTKTGALPQFIRTKTSQVNVMINIL